MAEEIENKDALQKEMDVLKAVVVPDEMVINGKKIDTRKAQPLNLGDQRALKKSGANLKDLSKTGDPDVLAELLFIFCRKINPEIKMEDIDTLTNSQMRILSKMVANADREVDRPT